MELTLAINQKQILSPRMQQSVHILQMNALDMDQYIREAALENPLIELELPQETSDSERIRLKKLAWLDALDESNFCQYTRDQAWEDIKGVAPYEKNPVDSLYDVLLAQIPGFYLDTRVEDVVRYIIGNLDENGYLFLTRSQLQAELAVDEALLDKALDVIHRMEPSGVGAMDLRECLMLQALRVEPASPALIQLIDKHLDVLAKNQLEKLARVLKVSIDEVKEARSQLLALNPKPGNGYSSYHFVPYIRPDIWVVRFENSFQIIFNDYDQPKIEISSYYRALAKDAGTETAAYLQERLHKAEWLVSCIQQRKSTILKCTGSILKRQIRFFERGPGNLMPMTLADVSEDLALHPSTISRAVRGKYLQCQWGVFGMADLFSHGISDAGEGGEQSKDMVRNRIKRILMEENPVKPFSDQEIANRLQESNICIARRTVAKYREELGFPSAGGRKKF